MPHFRTRLTSGGPPVNLLSLVMLRQRFPGSRDDYYSFIAIPGSITRDTFPCNVTTRSKNLVRIWGLSPGQFCQRARYY